MADIEEYLGFPRNRNHVGRLRPGTALQWLPAFQNISLDFQGSRALEFCFCFFETVLTTLPRANLGLDILHLTYLVVDQGYHFCQVKSQGFSLRAASLSLQLQFRGLLFSLSFLSWMQTMQRNLRKADFVLKLKIYHHR